jgi:hypothetical protein
MPRGLVAQLRNLIIMLDCRSEHESSDFKLRNYPQMVP